MIKTSEFQNRLLLLVVLVLANPVIQKIMTYLANLQAYTSKMCLTWSHFLERWSGFPISPILVTAIAQLFWPLVTTYGLIAYFKYIRKSAISHPNVMLCLIWLLFNGSYTLMQQGNL
jgi:hypothetical protein